MFYPCSLWGLDTKVPVVMTGAVAAHAPRAQAAERNRVCPLDAARIMSKGRQSFRSQWTNYQSNDQKECCWIFYCSHSKSLTLWDHELTTSRKPQRKAWIPFVEDKHNGDTYNCAASNRLRAKPCRQSC